MSDSDNNPQFIIEIAGPSGAGKSTLAEELVRLLNQSEGATLINLDNYFVDYQQFPKVGPWPDWDHPQNIDWDRLLKEIKLLKSGRKVETTKLDKKNFIRSPITLEPKTVLIIEGFLLFWHQKLRDLADLKIFLDIPEQKIVPRREARSGKKDPGYAKRILLPAYRNYIKPTKKYADVVVDGTKSKKKILGKVLNLLVEKE